MELKGAIGAAIGAVTELIGAVTQYGNTAAKAAAEQEVQHRCRASPTATTIRPPSSINELSEQFIQDVGTTTQQFTKLTAATTANGISVEETAEVYQFGRSQPALVVTVKAAGHLVATGQVFSKGKVQAEPGPDR